MTTVSREQAFTDGGHALELAWAKVFGVQLDQTLCSIIAGQIWGESQFGRAIEGYKPVEWGTNNWGSIQADQAWCRLHSSDPGWGYILLGDVHADGTPYVYPYRLYPRPWDAALDYLAFVRTRVFFDQVKSPRDYATHLKRARYYEAPLELYVKMVTNGQRMYLAALSLGLAPKDPRLPTGDDLPPNATDGKHLPGRVTVWRAPNPPARGFVSTVTDTYDLEDEELGLS